MKSNYIFVFDHVIKEQFSRFVSQAREIVLDGQD